MIRPVVAVSSRTVALLPLPSWVHGANHRCMATTRLLLVTSAGLLERRVRPWHHGLIKLRRFGLDRRISQGESTHDDLLIAARAQALISPRRRADLACWWQSVTIAAARPPSAGRAVRVDRTEALRAEQDINELVQTLRSGQPVSARGVAAARLLLTNGGGPVFRRTNPSLDAAVREVIGTLNPFIELPATPS